ncbi:MAG: exodeoxyribonuclease III [Spirochaetaceae bacterium]|nr:exodeoxyribonuclease III [Spirochaetaceae bacterium]
MRIVSWNVNGIRSAEKQGFLQWMQKESPDLLCIQETKARPEQLSPDLLHPPNYASYWASAKKPGYSGVAIYAKIQPRDVKPLGVPAFDNEGRVLQADFGEFVLICGYFPNSQEAGARLGYKLAFCQALGERCDSLSGAGRPCILCGDYNIAHGPLDLAHPKENEGNPGYLPEERAWLDSFARAGYVDTFRAFHPEEPGQYTWWSYRSKARERNIGWRLDYHWVNSGFMPRVKAAGIWSAVTGSDHCPVYLDIE